MRRGRVDSGSVHKVDFRPGAVANVRPQDERVAREAGSMNHCRTDFRPRRNAIPPGSGGPFGEQLRERIGLRTQEARARAATDYTLRDGVQDAISQRVVPVKVNGPCLQLRERPGDLSIRVSAGLRVARRVRIGRGTVERIREGERLHDPARVADHLGAVNFDGLGQATAPMNRILPRPSAAAASCATLFVTQSTWRSSSSRLRNVRATPSGPSGWTD